MMSVMSTDNTPTMPIPWQIALQATVRDGYSCRRCRRAVVNDDDRRLMCTNPHLIPELGNVLTLCGRCAALHEAGN